MSITHTRPRPLTYRPQIEVLEDRQMPSSFFVQTNLAADQAGVARIQDATLINAWGIALSPAGGAVWVSSTGGNVSELYTGDVNGSPFVKVALTVAIPGGLPTGQVFNASTTDFVVTNGVQSGRAFFIFASLSGQISGWNPAVPPPTTAKPAVAVEGAVYTGLAIGNNGTGNFLYAADFAGGSIDVFDRTFTHTTLAGNFVDPDLPDSYRPFNIQNLGGKLYVTYAKPDLNGSGFVSVFDTNGNFLDRLVSGNHLKAPWGLAIAPANFGDFSNAFLVGNHANGRISAYHPDSGKFLGLLRDPAGKPIELDGLWGLQFGNGVSFGDRNALYFSAGPDGGTHGLFGSLRVFVAAATTAGARTALVGGETSQLGMNPTFETATPRTVSAGGSNVFIDLGQPDQPRPDDRTPEPGEALAVDHSAIDALFGDLELVSVADVLAL